MRNLCLFICLLVFGSSTIFAQSWKNSGKISGEGPVVKRELNLDKFEKIGLAINAKVILEQGSQQKVTIEAQQNIINNIETKINKNSWSIKFDEKVSSHDAIKIYITMPTIKGLAIAGNGDIEGRTPFNGIEKLDISIAGNGDVDLAGSSEILNISIAGNGDVQVADFKAGDCQVSIAGSGDCFVHVTDNLKVSIAGSGDVNYKGSPRIKSSVAGSGSISSL